MSAELLLYLLAFCRITLVLVFAFSFFSKIRHITRLEQTVSNFKIVPQALVKFAARFFLGSEAVVVILAGVGGSFLYPGFLLALLLLLAFSAALASVLIRKIKTGCNCFGQSDKPVTLDDIWRNAGFILCALMGWLALAQLDSKNLNLNFLEWGFTAVVAAVFVAIWLHLSEIARLFRQI